MAKILIVEDDPDLAAVLQDALNHEGYRTRVAATGVEALTAVTQDEPDLLLLDRDLPVLSGDEVLNTLKRLSIPAKVLMLTAAGSIDDRVQGLDMGADDYLPKPFAYPELLARIRALCRRETSGAAVVLERGRLSVDTARRLVYCDGQPVYVTPKEYALLEELMHADGGFVSTAELFDLLWEPSDGAQYEVVKTAVYGLRRKLPDAGIIVSSRGQGYRIP